MNWSRRLTRRELRRKMSSLQRSPQSLPRRQSLKPTDKAQKNEVPVGQTVDKKGKKAADKQPKQPEEPQPQKKKTKQQAPAETAEPKAKVKKGKAAVVEPAVPQKPKKKDDEDPKDKKPQARHMRQLNLHDMQNAVWTTRSPCGQEKAAKTKRTDTEMPMP